MFASIAMLAGEAPAFFAEVAAVIVIGAVIAFAAFRIGLVPIVGFLLAGVLIGPYGLGLIRDPAVVDAAAEVGVVLLLFTIGIEFSIEKLGRIRRLIFVGGGLQVALATLLTLGVLALFGVPWKVGLYTGFLIALSSTAIVLKLLADRNATSAAHGQTALGVLIFQDLAVVAMVLVVPMMGPESTGTATSVVWALTKAALIIVAVLLFARRVMPRILEAVARTCSPEIFLLTIIAICFGTAYLTSLAGVSLSLGAFLAGLVVSESPFSEHALGEILPLQILFSATFFISVGMLLDLRFVAGNLPLVLGFILLVLVIKTLTTGAATAALRPGPAVVATSTLMLAQVGEFSFVLEKVGRDVGLHPAGLAGSGSQAFIAATVLLMVATPALSAGGGALGRRLERHSGTASPAEPDDEPVGPSYEDAENHVIVAGYGHAARRLTRALNGSGIPFVVTTLSPAGAVEAESAGHAVLRGDASRQRTRLHAGMARARVLIIADDDPAMAERIAAVARALNPAASIVVRTRYETEVHALHEVGADRVITEELESILQLFTEVLRTYRLDAAEIEAREEAMRRGDYAGLRSEGTAPADRLAACAIDARVPRPAGATADTTAAQTTGSAAFTARTGRPAAVDTDALIELPDRGAACTHLHTLRGVTPRARGCEECLRTGNRWVHLRICMTCGHVGCCDTSPNRHATAHHHATGHPVIRSLQPGEDWGWCYVDQVRL